jgi:hypothetical protein
VEKVEKMALSEAIRLLNDAETMLLKEEITRDSNSNIAGSEKTSDLIKQAKTKSLRAKNWIIAVLEKRD